MDQLTILFIGVIVFAIFVFVLFTLTEKNAGKRKHKLA